MNEQRFVVRIPWGTFGFNGQWWPNPEVLMSTDEQRRQNIVNGYIKPEVFEDGARAWLGERPIPLK